MIIMLVGVNDMLMAMGDPSYRPHSPLNPAFEKEQLHHAFVMIPSDKTAYHYSRMASWSIVKQLKNRYFVGRLDTDLPIQDTTGQVYLSWRENRMLASGVVNDAPDLARALEEYRLNLETIVDMAESHSARPIFVTQPTMWRSDLTEEEKNLLWLGWIGPSQSAKVSRYYSVSVLDKAMNQYNTELLEVCRKRNLKCLDLASHLQRDTTVFYDDDHFNEGGARKVAEFIAGHLGLEQ